MRCGTREMGEKQEMVREKVGGVCIECLVQQSRVRNGNRGTCREIGKHTISPVLCPHSLFHQLQELRIRDVNGGGVG